MVYVIFGINLLLRIYMYNSTSIYTTILNLHSNSIEVKQLTAEKAGKNVHLRVDLYKSQSFSILLILSKYMHLIALILVYFHVTFLILLSVLSFIV